jgi:hypothetical protein
MGLKSKRARDFEMIGALFPKSKKRNLEKARGIFLEIDPDPETLDRMIERLQAQLNSSGWQEQNGRFIPQLCKWLEDRPWESETTKAKPSFRDRLEASERRIRDLKADKSPID